MRVGGASGALAVVDVRVGHRRSDQAGRRPLSTPTTVSSRFATTGVAYDDDCLSIALTWRRDYADTGDARRGSSFRSGSLSAIWDFELIAQLRFSVAVAWAGFKPARTADCAGPAGVSADTGVRTFSNRVKMTKFRP